LAGKINGKHGIVDLPEPQRLQADIMQQPPRGHPHPLLYMHRSVPFTELTALYSVADACLLSSTWDGMNLVSFEYVACQDKKKSVLVLSEFAGSATFMRNGSIPFHPANTSEMPEALYAALNLGPEERQQKHEFLREFVNTHTR
jgi:trehalose 6-phosphate synthase